MGAPLAFLFCGLGIAGLFFLDRDKSVRTSKALWLPVIWLWIAGSRPVSVWLGNNSAGNLAATLDGSPMDAAIFEALIVAGVIVLFQRKSKAISLLKASGPVVIYFIYCLISVTWSPFPEPAFKRWIKAIGDLVMVLVLVTDVHPIAALHRLFSRLGFILFPASVLLIRYTDIGRAYDVDGTPMNTGVTTNKNTLGLIVYLVSLGALWSVRALLMDKKAPNRTRRLVAQATILTFGVVLLQMAHSATSVACFLLGGGLMLATSLRAIRNRPGRVHMLCLGIVLVGGLIMLLGGQSVVTSALGRDSTLSGRTDIWKASIAAADNPLFGTGYESFWNANAPKVARILTQLGFLDMSNLVSAHNGYLEVYLDMGLVGLSLIAFILISGYRSAGEAFRRNRQLGDLILAFVVTGVFYSITEAGFRVLSPSWIFLLLALVSANGFAAGLIAGEKLRTPVSRVGTLSRASAMSECIPDSHWAHT
jgi:exopolysaccharide production protein ExoQ